MTRHRAWTEAAITFLACSAAAPAGAGNGPAQDRPAQPARDAKFVKMEVPDKVVAWQVFEVKITMKNTGTETWKCTGPVHLHSQGPAENSNWGTNIIRVGQNQTAEPGQEVTLVSNLRASGTPGKVVFQWQARDSQGFVGEPTPAKTIQVEARPADPPSPARPARDPAEKQVLTFQDFEYVGSFKVPDLVRFEKAQGASTWSETGLALRRTRDGDKRMFLNYTHPSGVLVEVAIPELVKLDGGNAAGLKTAEIRQVWGPLRAASKDGTAVRANGGIWWDEDTRTLYWSTYHGYYANAKPWPVLGASRLENDGKVTPVGAWPVNVGWYKSYWGGVTRLSKEFADKHTGGKTLALGFGGYYSIMQQTSLGPALCVVSEPGPAKEALDAIDLVVYPAAKNVYGPRDGDYFLANLWGKQPDGPVKGYWTANDSCRAGVFIDLPTQHGFITFPCLATGRIGYDASAIYSAGTAQWWYCHDPKDLGEAAMGARKPWEVQAYSMDRVEYAGRAKDNPDCIRHVTGACFDPDEKILYIYRPFWIPVDRETVLPCVFAYRVK